MGLFSNLFGNGGKEIDDATMIAYEYYKDKYKD